MKRGLPVLMAIAGLALAGCDYRPLYGTTDTGGNVAYQLASISVDQQNTRLGQLVRNEIVSGISPTGSSGGNAYRLSFTAEASEFTSIDSVNTEPLRQQYKINASFTLIDSQTGKPVHSGKTFSQASYDRVDAPAANQERAAIEIGRDIRIRLAAYFSSHGDN
jgi:LPS-assembly lipoprotein